MNQRFDRRTKKLLAELVRQNDTTIINQVTTVASTQRAFQVSGITNGAVLIHNFHQKLGLLPSQYSLELRAYTSSGNLVVGITVAANQNDQATLNLTADVVPFTGTIDLDAIAY